MDTRALTTALVLSIATTASAQPGAIYDPEAGTEAEVAVGAEVNQDSAVLEAQVAEIDAAEAQTYRHTDRVDAPGMVRATPTESTTIRKRTTTTLIATEAVWGGGARFTGMSGIGALPGVNYGAEVSGYVRHQELFAELGFGWWRPEDPIVVTEGGDHVDLKLKVWTLRAGWAAMHVPLRIWGLIEAGEVAGAQGMPGVMARMVTGDMPQANRWQAVGAGFGVAWPMAVNARLFGMIEFAVPVNRGELMTDAGAFQPDPMAARSSVGLELGWR